MKEVKRIIKFRGFFDGKMYYPDSTQEFANVVHHCFSTVARTSDERTRCHIMQFTGLHDKNGKEIYEGDVFKGDDDYNGAVEWDNKAWGWSINWGPNARDPFSDYHMTEFEVIGNIYENPDLLT